MKELQKGFTVKGKYVIDRLQGEGILGSSVYVGYEKESGNDIIIRILPEYLNSDSDTVTRFIHGAKLARQMAHPNILKVIDAGNDDGVIFLISSHEKGFFLYEYLEQRGNLDENESVKLIIALAEALNYAWENLKIIHRNICPNSIFIAKNNVPMLTDFEVAKSLDDSQVLTMKGKTVGDPRYMSPEQVQGEDIDFHSDIYCLGLVFYQLLTGDPPFNDKSMARNLKSQLTEKPASIASKRKDVSKKCISIINKMLAKQPGKRYQSWTCLIDDLKSLIPSLYEDSSVTRKYQVEAVKLNELQSGKKSALKIVSLMVMILLIVTGLVYFFADFSEKIKTLTVPSDRRQEVKKSQSRCSRKKRFRSFRTIPKRLLKRTPSLLRKKSLSRLREKKLKNCFTVKHVCIMSSKLVKRCRCTRISMKANSRKKIMPKV